MMWLCTISSLLRTPPHSDWKVRWDSPPCLSWAMQLGSSDTNLSRKSKKGKSWPASTLHCLTPFMQPTIYLLRECLPTFLPHIEAFNAAYNIKWTHDKRLKQKTIKTDQTLISKSCQQLKPSLNLNSLKTLPKNHQFQEARIPQPRSHQQEGPISRCYSPSPLLMAALRRPVLMTYDYRLEVCFQGRLH